MPVVTLSRTFGSGGAAVGRMLAERLGAEYLDRELVARVAERSGIPEAEAEGYDERLPSLWQRLAAALATSGPEAIMTPTSGEAVTGPAVGERLFAITRAVVEEAAQSGKAVIVGRGAAWILAGRADLLRVQLHASLADRVRYLRARVEEAPGELRPDASDAELRDLCRSIDGARGAYIRSHFDADWMDLRNYDLALDTGRLGLARCVDLIELAAQHLTASATAPA